MCYNKKIDKSIYIDKFNFALNLPTHKLKNDYLYFRKSLNDRPMPILF